MRRSSSTPRRLALASIALSIALGIACSDSYETIVGSPPLTTSVVQDPAESILGEPDDHFPAMEIDWPSETPAYLAPASALADLVASAGGRVPSYGPTSSPPFTPLWFEGSLRVESSTTKGPDWQDDV